ncbi:putative SAUR-like auxin-responsive protein family [Hibiscus syriacus]|uniref:SAUR-like auxin-responsive protein family n=1 Tax=Hibiscus syriacus TaxID=106335 RepID=A0A6A3CA95_HIBSY|nr:auxin-responsive protein SAUR63-like [Hibiscus syriacus]KAE8724751.1 putative SAUR-like auxin-responsive protein family [Hibiscus syriacus]
MISVKKLIKLARKWQKLAAIKRKRITLSRTSGKVDTNSCSTSSKVEKCHFVVYSSDEKRFVLPFEYLNNEIVMELFQLAEEEFELQGSEHLTLPCDSALMEYVIGLIKKKASKEVEKALIMSVVSVRCSSLSYPFQQTRQQLLTLSA